MSSREKIRLIARTPFRFSWEVVHMKEGGSVNSTAVFSHLGSMEIAFN